MAASDSPPPSYYWPPLEPDPWPVTCPDCDREHRTTGEGISCPCGHRITMRDAEGALDSLREDRV